jgi:curli biogenesis system outer membrane secretion channel CsgG
MKYASLMQTGIRAMLAMAVATSSLGLISTSAIAQTKSKSTISVPSFKNETDWWWWRSSTARELGDALSNELSATGNFTVVERQKLDEVLSEQELTELGLARKDTGAKKGNITGAQYIVLGRVTAYEEGVEEESSSVGIGGINIGGISLGGGGRKEEQKAYIAIDLRVVDSTTSEVVYSRTVEGRATSEAQGVNAGVNILGVGIGGSNDKKKQAPVGKALRAALIEATDYLSCVMHKKDSCVEKYQAKDTQRREKTKGVLELE